MLIFPDAHCLSKLKFEDHDRILHSNPEKAYGAANAPELLHALSCVVQPHATTTWTMLALIGCATADGVYQEAVDGMRYVASCS